MSADWIVDEDPAFQTAFQKVAVSYNTAVRHH